MNRFTHFFLILLLVVTGFISGCSDDEIIPFQEVSVSEILAPNESITVTPNPNAIAPLTAIAEFNTKENCQISMSILREERIDQTFQGFSKEHKIPILGLYPGQANQVVITILQINGPIAYDTLTITTPDLPDYMPTININTVNPSAMEPGVHLCELAVGVGSGRVLSQPIMFDNSGQIIWYADFSGFPNLAWPIRKLNNGNLYFGSQTTIFEYSLLGEKLKEWKLPDNYNIHHEVRELPNGNFIVAVDKTNTFITYANGNTFDTIEDHMVEVDRNSGAIIQEWDLREILDIDRVDIVNGGGDWFHMNAIEYDPNDDTFIISGRNQGLVKVTRDNQLKWIMSGHQGWGKAGATGEGPETTPFLLTAIDAQGNPFSQAIQEGTEDGDAFSWPWTQHAPLVLPNGNVFVFDNGANRNYIPNGNNYSRGVEFKVDEENMTVEQIWQFGKERGEDFFSPIISDVDYLPNTQNRLIMPGIVRGAGVVGAPYAKIVEVSYPSGDVVFEATVHINGAVGAPLMFGDFDLVYRSHRNTLYSDAEVISLLN